jgi:hypothetical protein
MTRTLRKIRASVRMGSGKVRRFANGTFRKKHVARKLERRRGECIRCGTCCRLLFKCPYLQTHEDGGTSCRVHQKRPRNCRIFPVDRKCLAERDLLAPDLPCGYSFVGEDGTDPNHEHTG